MTRVLDARAEGQPGLPVAAMFDDLADRHPCDGLFVYRSSQIALDEIACAGADLRDIQPRGGLFRHKWAEIASVDQIAHWGLIGDIGEERVLALMQHAAVEPEGRGGQPDHLQRWVDPGQSVQKPAIHGAGVAGNEMRLVDQHQIGVADLGRAAVDRLDAGEEGPCLRLALAEARRIDARRSIGPEADHFGMVLGDQLAHMGHDQDALIGPDLQHALDEGRHDERLAACGRNDHQRIAGVGLEIAVDRGDRGLLVGAQGQHGAASGERASLVQVVPSAMR